MKSLAKIFMILVILTMAFSISVFSGGCSCDSDDDDDDDDNQQPSDDDDDNDTTDDDDAADDDDTADDDDDDTHDCEDLYDVIIEGQSNFTSSTSDWVAKLVINASGTIIGVVVPGSAEIDQYAISGFRYDQTTGYIRGSFPTPESMQEDCGEDIITNYMDFTIIDGNLTGVVTMYCGEQAEENLIVTGDATGTVTCGNFAE